MFLGYVRSFKDIGRSETGCATECSGGIDSDFLSTLIDQRGKYRCIQQFSISHERSPDGILLHLHWMFCVEENLQQTFASFTLQFGEMGITD